MVPCIFPLVVAGQQRVTMGGDGAFGSFVMGTGLMMAGSLQMMLGSELIMFRRLFVIFNTLLIFEMRHIGLVCFR
jgi:hypothetical protein